VSLEAWATIGGALAAVLLAVTLDHIRVRERLTALETHVTMLWKKLRNGGPK